MGFSLTCINLYWYIPVRVLNCGLIFFEQLPFLLFILNKFQMLIDLVLVILYVQKLPFFSVLFFSSFEINISLCMNKCVTIWKWACICSGFLSKIVVLFFSLLTFVWFRFEQTVYHANWLMWYMYFLCFDYYQLIYTLCCI